MKIKAIGFDWDGTVFPSAGYKREHIGIIYQELFKRGAEKYSIHYGKHFASSRREHFEQIASKAMEKSLTDDQFEWLSDRFDELNSKRQKKVFVKEPTKNTLVTLREKGIHIYLSSAVPQQLLEETVREKDVYESFDLVMGAGEPYGHKGREHVAKVIEEWSLQKTEILHVGDEYTDIKSSIDAGIVPVGLTGTLTREEFKRAGAHKVISDISEILSVIKGLEEK